METRVDDSWWAVGYEWGTRPLLWTSTHRSVTVHTHCTHKDRQRRVSADLPADKPLADSIKVTIVVIKEMHVQTSYCVEEQPKAGFTSR